MFCVYLLWHIGIVDLVTVANEIVLVGRTTHVDTFLRHEVVVRVAVGVATDASHLRLVRRRDLDDGRPNTVALHHQTEVGRQSHVHAVVANLEAGIGYVRVNAIAVDLRGRYRMHGFDIRDTWCLSKYQFMLGVLEDSRVCWRRAITNEKTSPPNIPGYTKKETEFEIAKANV